LATSADKAYDEIRMRILDGRLAPATRLREELLATEIGMSRTPVREALRRLAADGFVKVVPNQGASVLDWSAESIADLIEVRSMLAGMAARLAAGRISADEVAQLRMLNAQLADVAQSRRVGFLGEAAKINIAFHRIVFRAAGNPWLAQLLDQTAYLPMVQRAHHAFDVARWQRGIERYTDLIEALSAGDGEWAATLMQSHFLAARHLIVAQRGGASGGAT
jgi:DNA-binding GntR family transcriptional regulator